MHSIETQLLKMTPFIPQIRFVDIDAMGHVNNAVYFSYFEMARIHFFRQMIGGQWDWNVHGVLVVHNEIDYKSPVLFNDKIEIHVRAKHVGSRSFTVAYEVIRVNDGKNELCSTGSTVLVCFNHKEQKTEMVPELWRAPLEATIAVQ